MTSMAAHPGRNGQMHWAADRSLAVLGADGGWWWVQTHAASPPIARVSESPPVPAAVPASSAVQVLPVALPAPAEIADSDASSSGEAEPVPDRKRTQAKAAPAEPDN